ncbi:MAG: chromosome partitioning protein ParB, partial [Pseudomonadota bacterium]
LPQSVQALIESNALSAGHARVLIGADDPEGLAKEIVDGGLSVRQAEALRKGGSAGSEKPVTTTTVTHKDADTVALENNLTASLGLKVKIAHKGENGGEVKIAYKSLEQLDDICSRLSAVRSAAE